MKISSTGLAKIETAIKETIAKLERYAGMKSLSAGQREDFRDLQDQLRVQQRQYRTFSDSMSGL